MDENKKNKKIALKWLGLSVFFFVLAMSSVAILVLTDIGAGVLWIFVGCLPALAVCFYKLNKLGFVGERPHRSSIGSHITPDATPGIAGKTYVVGDKLRWPYY